MAKNIKKVAHDLIPLSDAVSELSTIVSELLNLIEPQINFNTEKTHIFFEECTEATDKLAISAELIRKYLVELNAEADRLGIVKD